MLLTRLVDSGGGGGSRLGSIIKGFLRKVVRGDRYEPGFLAETEPSLVKYQGQLTPLPAINGNAFSVVRKGAHEILSNYLARYQIRSLVADMRRRYAFRLMSGPVSFGSGLKNRIAIYGFIGVSLGNVAYNRVESAPLENSDWEVRVVKELFGQKAKAQFVSKNVYNEVEEDTLSVIGEGSVSNDSDIIVLSDNESDFEVLQQTESFVTAAFDDGEEMRTDSTDDVKELQELVEMELLQNVELNSLVQKLSQDNETLKQMTSVQTKREEKLKKELLNVLINMDLQRLELLKLCEVVQCQNLALKVLLDQHEFNQMASKRRHRKVPESGWTPRYTILKKQGKLRCSDLWENQQEKLRAAGGRMRSLKVHRKHRLKRN